MKGPKSVYDSNIVELAQQETQLKRKRSWMAWARLLVIVLIVFWLYNQWHKGWGIALMGVLVGIALFLVLVSRDVAWKRRLDFVRTLLSVNRRELAGLDYQYADWEDGAVFQSATHPYASDLDIFGKYSLFQYVNRAETAGGRQLLADYFSSAVDKTTIGERQDAVRVMAAQTEWRQRFQAYGSIAGLEKNIESDMAVWLGQPTGTRSKFWKVMTRLYPIITLTSVYLFLDDRISSGIFGFSTAVFILFSFAQSKKSNAAFGILSKFYPKVSKMGDMIACLEELKIDNSIALRKLQEPLWNTNDVKASVALKQLGKILGLFEARLNVFLYFFLNTFLLWDVRVGLSLNEWKLEYGAGLSQWLAAIYQAEAFDSLATLSFNRPDWVFPTIEPNYYSFSGTGIGHPLIPTSKRVDNDFSIDGQGKIALITGSNMGGKSTFLRSLGVNMVLAYSGAPVCAKSFAVSVVQLMSSMRIADNLAENTSTFYAELKKIRAILEAVNAKQKVFVLLDEILRGTNSLDRHAGSKALMLQLIREHVVAVIATHDVELANLVNEQPDAIANYHFDVQVDNNDELFFDYQLKPGVCRRMNAAILMKQIGIEM
ncbi:MAG: hypothetical protein QM610_09415 [Chitinophagaceae bacterium]